MSYFDDNLKKPTKYQDQLENYLPIANKDFNEYLCKVYPFLIPRNRWSGIRITEAQNGGYWPGDPEAIPEYDYEYTELDSMPEGWKIAFGPQLCEELKQELIKFDYLDKYEIIQIKEKFGSLRWYDNGYPIGKLELIGIEEYEDGMPEHDRNTDWYRYLGVKDNKAQYEHYKILDRCKVGDIINKYERLSARTCIKCGQPATKISLGWISPWCNNCAKDIRDECMDINEYFSEE